MAKNNEDIKIRKMVEDDLARVNGIDRLVIDEKNRPLWPFSFEIYWRTYSPNVSFVAYLDGEVIGFVVGNILEEHSQSLIDSIYRVGRSVPVNQKIGWLDMVEVLPEHRHKKIGQMLVESFYKECRNNNSIMMSRAKASDEKVNNYWLSLGFKKSEIVTYRKE